jgi:hypothetical protein
MRFSMEKAVREAGEKAVNARTLWDAGVTYGFGTDTGYLPREGLKPELRALSLMFFRAGRHQADGTERQHSSRRARTLER